MKHPSRLTMGMLTLEESGGERFHAGGLEISVPMQHDDLVGVLVDLRSPKSFSLEFVLNRQSAGRDHRMSEVYVKGKPLYPCVVVRQKSFTFDIRPRTSVCLMRRWGWIMMDLTFFLRPKK